MIGLKHNQKIRLERIYRRRISFDHLITNELARYITELSKEIGREIGILIDRKGNIIYVAVGASKDISLPYLKEQHLGKDRLLGIRYIHTQFNSQGLSKADLTHLALLRFDLIAAIEVCSNGLPGNIYIAHLLPYNNNEDIYNIMPACQFYKLSIDFGQFITSLEREILDSQTTASNIIGSEDRAILVGVGSSSRLELNESMEELKELARTSHVQVLDTIIQRIPKTDPRYLLGSGKVKDMIIRAQQLGAKMICFDQELNSDQFTNICSLTDLKIIDRPQLILDIFAKRAHTLDGKVQVELAQLKFLLPRLKGKGTAMSRLMGGIGGRGPGETKLEIDRRRVRERIQYLEKRLSMISKQRRQKRSQRLQSNIPICSIIGYTNAGKSTLLNALTNSSVFTENLLFATLDTSTRRLRFPREKEIIITDTVGFIRSLPETLLGAFKATLEELDDASFLIHVVDIHNPFFEDHIESVNRILKDFDLDRKPFILCFNKIDLVDEEIVENVCQRYRGVGISSTDRQTLIPLLRALEFNIWQKDNNRRY